VPGGSARRRRFREGPEKARRAVAALGRARRRAAAARVLEGLDLPELLYAAAIAGEDARERIDWWLKEGRAVRSAVDGDRLIALGARPGPALGRALAAALDAAREGADEAAQLEAARRALRR